MPKRAAIQDTITLMLFEGSAGGGVRRIDLRRRRVRRVSIAVGLVLAVMLGICIDYVRVGFQLAELTHFRTEYGEQRHQIRSYAEQLEGIAGRLEELDQLERKLRALADLVDPAASAPPASGMGGVSGRATEPAGESSPATPGGVGGVGGGGFDLWLSEPAVWLPHRPGVLGATRLAEAIESRIELLGRLLVRLEYISAKLLATPSITPTRGWVSSSFGRRTSPFTSRREFHRGIDIAGRRGTPVIAAADGVVSFSGTDGPLGRTLHVRHGYGVVTKYGHLGSLSVARGDSVSRGQKIGTMGSTGRSTGPHLHYQVEVDRKPVDPRSYMLD